MEAQYHSVIQKRRIVFSEKKKMPSIQSGLRAECRGRGMELPRFLLGLLCEP